jgi:hypothetical protein
MSATRTGRIAGLTGTGTLGFTVAALARASWAHGVPAGMWAVLAALAALTVATAGLGLVLDYWRDRLELKARAQDAQALASGKQARLELYRALVEKSASEPARAASYRALILADALHLAVEQNGVRPADRTHGQLFGGIPGQDVTHAMTASTTPCKPMRGCSRVDPACRARSRR